MTEGALAYEDDLTAAIKAEFARLTKGPSPYTQGVQYGSVVIDGPYPTGTILVRFEQSEHPGQQFGLRLCRLRTGPHPTQSTARVGSLIRFSPPMFRI